MGKTMAKCATKAAKTSSRLSVDDWIDAAMDILAKDGANQIRIDRLCQHLRVTKGSFYWHFEDIESFRLELAKRWFSDRRIPDGFKLGPETTPRANVETALRAFMNPRFRTLSREMRNWSSSNKTLASFRDNADSKVFELLRDALKDMGFNAGEADMRAKILFYFGVGYSQTGVIGISGAVEPLVALLLDGLVQKTPKKRKE